MGKAKSLKKRLSQYAHAQDDRPQIFALTQQTHTVQWEVLESELQALLVEAELIKRYQPHFNILLKDDKSDLYICLSKDTYPRIFTARKPEILRSVQKLTTFGPFPSGLRVSQVLSIARSIFKWCDHPDQDSQKKRRACFYYHINLCDGACIGASSPDDYQNKMTEVKQFLNGKTAQLISSYKQEIERHVLSKEFEQAALIRDRLQTIVHVTSPKYRLAPDLILPTLTSNLQEESLVSLRAVLRQYLSVPATAPLTRIEGYDVSNIMGTNASCSMVVAINGQMDHQEYKHFGIKTLNTPNDFGMLKEALSRRQGHPEWGIPDVILIDGGKGQLRSVLSVWKWPSIVISIAKKPDRLLIPILSKSTKKSAAPSLTYKEIPLTDEIAATRLIQTIRDESHRFAKRLHTIKRTNNFLT